MCSSDLAELAAWVARVIAGLGVERAALVGHSMGGLVALEAAASYPERVWALALLGVSESMRVHPALLAAATAREHSAAELVVDWGLGRRAHLGGYRAPGVWMTGAGLRVIEGNIGALGIDLAACNAYAGAPAAADKVRCPTLILAGADDRMTPLAGANALVKRINGARLVAIPASGHMMMIEQPDATLVALAQVV